MRYVLFIYYPKQNERAVAAVVKLIVFLNAPDQVRYVNQQ